MPHWSRSTWLWAELLLRSEALSELVKFTGALVLIGLGARSLWAAWRVGVEDGVVEPARTERRSTPFLQGLLTNLTNPKATLFSDLGAQNSRL